MENPWPGTMQRIASTQLYWVAIRKQWQTVYLEEKSFMDSSRYGPKITTCCCKCRDIQKKRVAMLNDGIVNSARTEILWCLDEDREDGDDERRVKWPAHRPPLNATRVSRLQNDPTSYQHDNNGPNTRNVVPSRRCPQFRCRTHAFERCRRWQAPAANAFFLS
jgi:hypothetical protein